jgi:hypothetical protein
MTTEWTNQLQTSPELLTQLLQHLHQPLPFMEQKPLNHQLLEALQKPLFPLALGDLTLAQTPLWEWQTYQSMYYQTILRLHPDHPQALTPEELDSRTLQYPVAQTMILIRQIIMELKRIKKLPEDLTLPPWLQTLLPIIKPLLALDHWACILTIWMPMIASSIPTITWNQVHHVLGLITSAVLNNPVSNSGSPYQKPKVIPKVRHEVVIEQRIINKLHQYEGRIWKVYKDSIIEIPLAAWEKFGNGKFNMKEYHDFQELAWLQVCQFCHRDFVTALKQVKFYDECNGTILQYRAANEHKYNYINLVHVTRVYQVIHKWIAEDKYWGTDVREEQSPKPTLSVLAQQTLQSIGALPNRTGHGNQSTYPIEIATIKKEDTQGLQPGYNSEDSSDMEREGTDDGFWGRD